MRSVVCAALLVIGAGQLAAAEANLSGASVLPADPANAVGVILVQEPGGWLVFRQQPFEPVQTVSLNGGAGIAWEDSPGQFVVLYFPAGQQIPQPEVTMVKLGAAPQPPPGPDPTFGQRLKPPNDPATAKELVSTYRQIVAFWQAAPEVTDAITAGKPDWETFRQTMRTLSGPEDLQTAISVLEAIQ